MQKIALLVLGICFGLLGVPAQASPTVKDEIFRLSASDFLRLYPEGLFFEIHRNGQPIGFHRAIAVQDGDTLRIENHTQMKTRAFFNLIPYELEYRSESRWQDDRFLGFSAKVDEQDDHLDITLTPLGAHTLLRVNNEEKQLRGTVIPSPNWLSVYITGLGLLDGLSGKIENVSYEQAGSETVMKSVLARRFEVVGDTLEATEWYDHDNRWLALSFTAPDGSKVDYICVICGGEKQPQLTLN